MFTPYAPRRLSFLGTRVINRFQLKCYSLQYGDGPFDYPKFEPGLSLAVSQLPSPAKTDGRPGVGFIVMHQGRTGDYLILGWWDRENELPLRVFVREETTWRPAVGGESLCVWDLRVLWHEREAYVATILGGDGTNAGAVEAYLNSRLDGLV